MNRAVVLAGALLGALAVSGAELEEPDALQSCKSDPSQEACKPDPLHELEPMQPNLEDLPSLQRGMALYMNFCVGCHSLKFQRYERTVDDLAIPHDVALRNLVFTGAPIGALMETAMPPASAKNWFGAPPPDLTMVDRVRGTAWVYNMLKSFYVDAQRPFGVNNRVFDNIGMPHVLIGLQGVPEVECRGFKPVDVLEDVLADGAFDLVAAGADAKYTQKEKERAAPKREPNCNFIVVPPGSGAMTAAEYDQAAYDIANFLHYVGEPGRAKRQEIGFWVLGFLALLFVLATFLNREYWKDIH